ncbi:energy transducer TonB [Geobacter pickeringii]|uniref:Energy transducer TonB n=1 Tax=Geobacter pickeringii TaxID=345632 RepID=A0A0B5BJR0_9BACT|nr:energy transducer TonB [Geobacter pickeringii]AJE04735.1 energy transducer TonB [Geobacter pickeringii]
MNRTPVSPERGLGWGITASLILHAVLFSVVLFARFPSPSLPEAPVYYVDVVNLPVASPRAGSPTVAGGSAPETPPPAPPKPEMALPRKPVPTKGTLPGKQKPPPSEESGREFEQRLAKLQKAADERHEEDVLAAMRKKMAGSARSAEQAGMPGATGTQAGSDYASYIQSRLRDAFRGTIAYQTKSPEVVVRLTIDAGGHIARQRIERTSGDRIFEESVSKAIARAEKTFSPPPGGGEFEYGFIFRPQGVGKK